MGGHGDAPNYPPARLPKQDHNTYRAHVSIVVLSAPCSDPRFPSISFVRVSVCLSSILLLVGLVSVCLSVCLCLPVSLYSLFFSRLLLLFCPGLPRNMLGKTCLVIGAGGLASAVLPYLAGAGVGHIVIMDFDKVWRRFIHLYRRSASGRLKCAWVI